MKILTSLMLMAFLLFSLSFAPTPIESKLQLFGIQHIDHMNELSDKNFYPFYVDDDPESYAIYMDVESPEIKAFYEHLFSKYDYSGNGYCWQGIIKQILKSEEPSLLKNIRFESTEEEFYAVAKSGKHLFLFFEKMCPILINAQRFEEILKNADREKIENE